MWISMLQYYKSVKFILLNLSAVGAEDAGNASASPGIRIWAKLVRFRQIWSDLDEI